MKGAKLNIWSVCRHPSSDALQLRYLIPNTCFQLIWQDCWLHQKALLASTRLRLQFIAFHPCGVFIPAVLGVYLSVTHNIWCMEIQHWLWFNVKTSGNVSCLCFILTFKKKKKKICLRAGIQSCIPALKSHRLAFKKRSDWLLHKDFIHHFRDNVIKAAFF